MRSTVLFPDTNVFLQCKSLKELPWSECFDVDRIDLLVGAPVQDEIDRLKQDGNHRRARRARDTNSLFSTVLESANETIVLRESRPQVVLGFAPTLPTNRTQSATLDLTRADERLIDEVQYYSQRDASAQILSGDTGLRLRARRHGVSVAVIPDSWMLPPENDERDKEITALKTQLTRLQRAEPALELTIRNAEGQDIHSLSAAVPYYSALSAEDVDRFVAEVQQRYPKAADFGRDPPLRADPAAALHAAIARLDQWQAPSQVRIDDYRKTYDAWISKVRRRFERVHALLNVSTRVLPLQLELRNTGFSPADEVLFQANAHTGLHFFISEDDSIPQGLKQVQKLKREIVLAMPPQVPKGESSITAFARTMSESGFGPALRSPELYLPRISHLLAPGVGTDRHEFYRRDQEAGPVTSCSFSRPEFRHRSDSQIFRLWICVPQTISPAKSHLYFRISARNLTTAVCIRLPISLEYQSRVTVDVAQRWRVKTD